MSEADSALLRACKLSLENHTDEVEAEFERLLLTLVDAGYEEAEEHLWRFTREGVARANELTGGH